MQVGCIVRGEQRTHTMLVFMSNVAEDDGGGHLHFPVWVGYPAGISKAGKPIDRREQTKIELSLL